MTKEEILEVIYNMHLLLDELEEEIETKILTQEEIYDLNTAYEKLSFVVPRD